jgi:hypothetical protein
VALLRTRLSKVKRGRRDRKTEGGLRGMVVGERLKGGRVKMKMINRILAP